MGLGGAKPVGSSRSERLDPLALPVRFMASDAGADERLRQVELTREHVVLRRAVRGIHMQLNIRVTAFLGVALRLIPCEAGAPDLVTIWLEHRDSALSVPLYAAPDGDDVAAEWQLWGRVLRLPLLVADVDGTLHAPFAHIGPLRIAAPTPRRRRRSAVKARRPSILMRRQPRRLVGATTVHRGEREIIARN
jgi:Family of unknown function (DUF6101)